MGGRRRLVGMEHPCPNTACKSLRTVKAGFFHRSSDHCSVQRYRCKDCGTCFSDATGAPEFLQKKRYLNDDVLYHLASSVSQNRLALLLHTTRKTIAHKLQFLGSLCKTHDAALLSGQPPADSVQFDELETFEHTKCKPISVALAVEENTRRILGFEVSQMPATGKLAKTSQQKYGKRKDERCAGLKRLFQNISPFCAPKLSLLSDQCPRYAPVVAATLGAEDGRTVTYAQVKGARGCSTGQGELKKLVHDPLFSLNHTCAMLRANINRLVRRTWNTTKKITCLENHLHIYMHYHNTVLQPQAAERAARRAERRRALSEMALALAPA